MKSVFERFNANGITINPNKCRFGISELDFIGYHIDKDGITPLPGKVQGVQKFPKPETACQLRRFIGMVNFYHRFIPHIAEIMEQLHTLIAATRTKSQVLNWTDRALCAFESTKETLAKVCLLSYPSTDAPTSIVTDTSDIAVGAVLQQYVDGAWKPISFFSKAMKPAERRYSTFDKELLAIYLAIKHFRHFIEGRHFHVLTDHKPLTFAMNTRSDRYSPRQSRHLDYISQFTSII